MPEDERARAIARREKFKGRSEVTDVKAKRISLKSAQEERSPEESEAEEPPPIEKKKKKGPLDLRDSKLGGAVSDADSSEDEQERKVMTKAKQPSRRSKGEQRIT